VVADHAEPMAQREGDDVDDFLADYDDGFPGLDREEQYRDLNTYVAGVEEKGHSV
jgi:hypothetical protein